MRSTWSARRQLRSCRGMQLREKAPKKTKKHGTRSALGKTASPARARAQWFCPTLVGGTHPPRHSPSSSACRQRVAWNHRPARSISYMDRRALRLPRTLATMTSLGALCRWERSLPILSCSFWVAWLRARAVRRTAFCSCLLATTTSCQSLSPQRSTQLVCCRFRYSAIGTREHPAKNEIRNV